MVEFLLVCLAAAIVGWLAGTAAARLLDDPAVLLPIARLGERLGISAVFDAIVRLLDATWAVITAPLRRIWP